MDKDKIALDFIRVYKKYKDRNFLTRKLNGGEKGVRITNQNKRKKSRLGNIESEM
jgi:hypothetical protein